MNEYLKCMIGILIPFVGTTSGAAVVFAFKNNVSIKVQKMFLGFAAGVMFAASIWSLIIPSIDMTEGVSSWIPATVGIVTGTIFLMITDVIEERIQKKNNKTKDSRRTRMLNFAITLHNIPEGMAVGIVFASSLTGNFGVEFMSAMALAIGIAIQNFPEGMAISLPYKASGETNKKSFLYGTLSGVVEPIAAIITLLISSIINSILPYLLAFAAGTMLYVIICELIPDSQEGEYSRLATVGVIVRIYYNDDFRYNTWINIG